MSKLVPKLNLNRTPQTADNGSLVYAKNIKLNKDGTIGPDYNFIKANINWGSYTSFDKQHPIVGYIVGLNNKVYYFINYENIRKEFNIGNSSSSVNNVSKIIEYNEITDESKEINSSWTYHNGTITGFVTTNHTGEEILTICESSDDSVEIPIKHINLSHPEVEDESLYTQNPVIPITNLHLEDTYSKTIPNGVYQFFVRYKISDNFYTPWIPCSKECFAGVSTKENTCSGSLKYIDIKKDSSKSFVFSVEHLFDNVANYESFQLGFILSHDNEVVARIWKEFNFNTNIIYFDYDKYNIKEIDIDEFLKTNFELFNVKNATFFRNKCYISNYKETDFNPQLQSYANNVRIVLEKDKVFDKNPEYTDVYFNNTRLVKDETLNAYTIFDNIIYGDSYTTFTQNSIIEDTVKESEILKFSYIYDYNLDPDIAWINEATGVIKFNNLGSNYTRYLDYANGIPPLHTQNNVNLVYTDEIHPLEENNYKYYFHNKWFIGSGHNVGELKADDKNFKQQELINFTNEVINASKNYINNKAGNFLLTKFQIITNVTENVDVIIFDDIVKSEIANINGKAFNTENELNNYVNSFIQGIVDGFVYNGEEYLYKGSFANSRDSFSGTIRGYVIEYTKVNITDEKAEYDNNSSNTEQTIILKATKTNYTKTVYIKPNQSLFKKVTESDEKLVEVSPKQYTSLMPFTEYKFYIHYVKNNGVITNGFEIPAENPKERICENYPNGEISVIYPKISNVVIPDGYVAYFISMSKIGNDICKLFNRSIVTNEGKEYEIYDCIEADLLLYNLNNKISVIDSQGNLITSDAIYCSSGCTNPMFMFGNSGSVIFELDESRRNITDTDAWIQIINKKEHIESHEQLVRITPYIKESDYSNYKHMNLPSYLCEVYKIDKNIKTNNKDAYYFAGTEVYKFTDSITTSIKIEHITDYINIRYTNSEYILSNFNLNYLTLTEDVNNTIRSYKIDETDESESAKTQIVKIVNTLTSSDIYELPQMYKEYTRKYFSIYNSKNITKFTNTIRSSDTNTDEVYRNIFTFYAGDYYNVPCNRGPIVNMFSIADSIYVHCEHSLYKFSGNTSLSANNGEVQTKETNVFDSGIKELFDSEFGYGGIQSKTHSLISYFAYVFYDEYAKKIYYYGGENQLSCISDSIEKILDSYNILDIVFVDDYHNNRFFVNLKVSTKEENSVIGNICLSYSYLTKSFISIHDIDFIKGFCTRHNTYFLHTTNDDLRLPIHSVYRMTTNVVTVPKKSTIGVIGTIYTGLYRKSLISVPDLDNYCCIDVIFNDNYEIIKNIEKVSWVCSAIKSFIDNNYMAEENLEIYPGDIIQIYSDQCCSEKTTMCEHNVSVTTPVEEFIQNNEDYHYTKFVVGNGYDALNPNVYKYPRFNCGIWSLNYFRDIRNNEDKFNYGSANDKSLIYGKYFVIRFAFGIRNCKIENINIIANNYDKV